MGKASKRERQKLNKAIREEETARKQSRDKAIKAVKMIALILVVPIIAGIALVVNNATDPDEYTAKITVAIDGEKDLPNGGVIEVALDDAFSPDSVKHFTGFASNGLYDGLSWHRAAKDFVIQGGDPSGDGTGQIGKTITAELPRKGYKPGDLAWAKESSDPPGTAGSQFFIVTGDKNSQGLKTLNTKTPSTADGEDSFQYGYIGRVTKGLDLARKVEALAPQDASDTGSAGDGKPTKKAIIVKIEIFKNGTKIKNGDLIPATTASTTTTPLTIPASSTP